MRGGAHMPTSEPAHPAIATDPAARLALSTVAADSPTLRALSVPYLTLGHDGPIRNANPPAQSLAAGIESGAPLGGVLSVPLETLFAAAEAELPRPPPALLRTATRPSLVLAQPVRVADGLLVLIISLDAVQQAEERKFEMTPYGVVRLRLDGVVDFANSAARRLWNEAELVGRDFVDLLPEAFHDEFRAKLNDVLDTKMSRSVKLTSGATVLVGERMVHSEPRLTLLPEFLLDSTLRGVLVVIREGILDALRVALREAALETAKAEPTPCSDGGPAATCRDRTSRMLDVLREAVPHGLAIVSEVSGSGDWVLPILLHPDPPQRWPRMWWRMSEAERKLLDSGVPYREELSNWLAHNPDRKDEPLLKLLQEVRPKGKPLESFAVVPIRPLGRTEAVLTLASTQPGHFRLADDGDAAEDAQDELPRDPLAVLARLGLDTLLVAMLRRARREEEAARRNLVASIESAGTVPEATFVLLRELVGYFGWDHAAVFTTHHTDAGETFRLFAQFPETEDGAPHPIAIPPDYTQPLYDPGPGAPLDEAHALASGMLGAAVRSARHGGSGVLVAPDATKLDTAGRRPHWFRSISDEQRSALTIAITINGRTRWVLDTVSRHANAFIEEDGDRVAPLVKRLAARVSALRDRKLNDRLTRLIDEAVLITDDSGVILRANPRACELLGLPPDDDGANRRLPDFVRGPDGAKLPGADQEYAKLLIGPVGGIGVETRIRRLEDTTETPDIIWLLRGADRETYNADTRYIAETVQEVARQVRAPLLLAATLVKQLGRGALQDAVAPVAKQVREEIAKADITFERLAEARGARRQPKREERVVPLAALLGEL